MRSFGANQHRTMRSTRRKSLMRRGATLVEFALVAQIFFLFILTCMEFCRLNMIRNLAQDAAYYAARSAMVPGATVAEAKSEANRILGFMNTRNAIVTINGDDTLDENSEQVSVQIVVPIDDNSFFVPHFSDNMNFTANASMRTERYDGFFDGT